MSQCAAAVVAATFRWKNGDCIESARKSRGNASERSTWRGVGTLWVTIDMARSRLKSKGRKGGESERFALIPESALTSTAFSTMPHASVRVLLVLVMGHPKERNGVMACTESHAAKFGIASSDTLHRSLRELEHRGFIFVTARAPRMRKVATLYAVSWWPNFYLDRLPLTRPDPPTHKYLTWNSVTPTIGVQTKNAPSDSEFLSLRPSEHLTPVSGVKVLPHHSDGVSETAPHHSDGRRQSISWPGGRSARGPLRAARARSSDTSAPGISLTPTQETQRAIALRAMVGKLTLGTRLPGSKERH